MPPTGYPETTDAIQERVSNAKLLNSVPPGQEDSQRAKDAKEQQACQSMDMSGLKHEIDQIARNISQPESTFGARIWRWRNLSEPWPMR